MVSPRPETSPSPALSLPAVIAWLAIQLVGLMLGVFRVPLAARAASPGEQWALHEVLAIQIVAASLLFPVLMPNWRTATVILLTSIPFAQLAGFLSNIPVEGWWLAAGLAAGWIGALAMLGAATRRLDTWRSSRRTDHTRPRTITALAVATASAFTVGGAVLWYLRAEFGTSSSAELSSASHYGPLAGALAQTGHAQVLRGAWATLLGLLATAATLLAIASRLTRRRTAAPVGA